jgi:L-ascorbate metabolism protein UlaG (beta-lactamase superfamily)
MSVIITWFGHATLGIRYMDYDLVVDPYFSDNPAASTSADQISADYILVSHGHSDHIGDTVAIARRTGATVISNNEIANWLKKQDVKTQVGTKIRTF